MPPASGSIYDIEVCGIGGDRWSMSRYRGRVLLIVNVASRCGYTPQYAGLESLYRRYGADGFDVLAFPCDQFGHQEPGTDDEIRQFCEVRYDVTFPLFGKIDVNGDRTHPLYRWLKSQQKGLLGSESIKWNFTKFLVDRHGTALKRYAPSTPPSDLEPDIREALAVPIPA